MIKVYAGCYRISSPLSWTAFAHIRRDGSLWKAEIRDTETGDFRMPAGLWSTLRDAASESRDLLCRQFKKGEPTMSDEPSASDRADFRGYLRNCSDRQVHGVLEKETEAGRQVYAELAQTELERRGIA